MGKKQSYFIHKIIVKFLFKAYNILGFKICWWACVMGAISNQKYLGPILVSIYLFIHLYGISPSVRISEIYLLLFAGFFGTVADSMLLNLNILSYQGLYVNLNYIAPLWITAMWVGFTATLNHAFNNIISRYYIQFILGLIAGPAAYITGNSLGAITFSTIYSKNTIIIIIAIVWGFSFPMLCWVSNILRYENSNTQ
tara:strand:- start:2538 stop:3128 length:591 start_codon:yes stop_codon:yes gene_type:complete